MLKFIVLADTHIVPEGQLSHEIDTRARLDAAVAFVNDHHGDADFVVFAGDLADRGESAAYHRFRDAIAPLAPPVHLTLGNHDHRPTFLEIFGAGLATETGNVDHVIDAKGYRVIVLDSSDPALRGAGRLEDAQIAWLKARLKKAQERPVVVVLHHNITPLHVQTDLIILEDRAAFADALRTHPDIRQVISGHVHMTASGTYAGIPFCTFAGGHYSIEPTLESRSGPVPEPVPRREGPGQLAVVLCTETSVVVHMENFLDSHAVLPPENFQWGKG
ncbi:MAG: metallophosphoesterase [Pseudomonadota bacterium]